MAKNSMDQEKKRDEILEAACELFARFGFKKTTLEDIGDEVRLGKASLYYYFRSKDELIKEVAKRSLPLDVISRCLYSGLRGKQLLKRIAEEYMRKYSCDTNKNLLFQALSIKSMYPVIEREISEVCNTLLNRVAEKVYGSLDLDKRVRVKVFFGALLCYALSGVKETDIDTNTYISKVIEIVM